MPYSNFNWIDDRLAVGGLIDDVELLPFDAILSLETHAPLSIAPLARSDRVTYCWQSIVDRFSYEHNDEIVRRFDAAAEQIAEWLQEGKRVLVHCTAGVSRSVSAVIWYLVRYEGYTWDAALAKVRRIRPAAFPHIRVEIPVRPAAGEHLTEEQVMERVAAYCDDTDPSFVLDPEEVRADLERQGTLPLR